METQSTNTHSYSRRHFLKQLGMSSSMIALSGIFSGFTTAEQQPNILIIMADDHATNAISCYDSKINTTPNIDRIAAEGIKFNNCFCTNSLCAPSRAAILTGMYSHLNGVMTNKDEFNGSQMTFPKILRYAGYQTALIGKWHLSSTLTGFDYWQILQGQGAYYNPQFEEIGGRTPEYHGYVTDIVTDLCLNWLKDRDRNKPFCLLVHHNAPHRNFEPDNKHNHLYNEDLPYPASFNDDYDSRCSAASSATMTIEKDLFYEDLGELPPPYLSTQQLKEWKYQHFLRRYLRCVAAVDDNVGRLLNYLDEINIADNTVVIYTSDQGFFLGEHGWFDKRFMYEESIRMPLLVRYPNEISAGLINNDIVLNLDIAPTLLDFANVTPPSNIQGQSFRSLLHSVTPYDWRQSMYYHYYAYPNMHNVNMHYGIRTHRFKLIHFYNDIDEWELYDLQQDPDEMKNLYNDPMYAAIAGILKEDLTKLRIQYKVEEPILIAENLESSVVSDKYVLLQNYPNPFNASTKITYSIPENEYVSVKIYNVRGAEIKTLFQGLQKAGVHTIDFDASHFASGEYIYKLETSNKSKARKMLLIH